MSRVERHAEEEAARSKKSGEKKESKGKKGRVTPFGRFLNIIGTLIMIAAIVVALGLIVPDLIGYQSFVVISGSMEPEIPVGSMVYARETDPSTLQTGDIIVFYSTDAVESGAASGNIVPVTHRVVQNDTASGEIITKGDANEQNDLRPVVYNNVVGKVALHLPKIGYLASPFATLAGKLSMVMVILAGYLLTEVGSHMRRE